MKDKEFQTSDIYLASYLVGCGYDLKGVDGQNKRHATFRIASKSGIDKETMRFINGKGSVEPRVFMDQVKCLKTMALATV